jgi:hypothetical protein
MRSCLSLINAFRFLYQPFPFTGDVVLAAKKLGIGRSTLYQYLVDQKLKQAARKKGKP